MQDIVRSRILARALLLERLSRSVYKSPSIHLHTSTYHKDILKDVMDEINSEISSLLTKFVVRSQNTSLLDRKYCRSRIAVNTDTQLSSARPRPHLHDFQTARRGTNQCAMHCEG